MKKLRLVDAAKSAGAPTNGLVVDTAGRQRMLLELNIHDTLGIIGIFPWSTVEWWPGRCKYTWITSHRNLENFNRVVCIKERMNSSVLKQQKMDFPQNTRAKQLFPSSFPSQLLQGTLLQTCFLFLAPGLQDPSESVFWAGF